MKKIKRRFLSLLMTAMLLMLGAFTAFGAETAASANHFNVVFVLDASGSMKQTDSALWRYEAMDLFLGLATEQGNRIGAVVFNDGIVSRMDLQDMNGKQMKENLSQALRNSAIGGDTDIGTAIQLAATMLDESRDTTIPSAIILLSDGNTDLPADTTGQQLAQSNANKQDAVNRARANSYPVYSICLNANGQANPAELADIANATGGVFMEVNNAEDLKEVFAKFYNMIYSTATVNIADDVIPEGGVMEIPFEVPSVGVEEVNIIISTLSPSSSYSVFQPTGLAYTSEELAGMTIQAQTFSVIKIPAPMGGNWKIQVRGIPGDAVKIDMVYNADFTVNLTSEPAGGNVASGQSVSFRAELIDADGQKITDSTVYGAGTASLSIRSSEDDGEIGAVGMQQTADGAYEAQAVLSQDGSCYAVAVVRMDGLEKSSGSVSFQVGEGETETETTAAVQSSTVEWKISKMPFGSSIKEYDLAKLNPNVSQWEIMDSDYARDIVYLDGNILKADTAGCEDGMVILSGEDDQGLVQEYQVEITVSGLLGIILTVVLVLLVLGLLLALLMILKKATKKHVFKGDIMAIAFDNNLGMMDSPQTIRPGQGRVPMSRYLNEGGGVDLKQNYFQADASGDYIWVISKAGLYSSMNPDKKEKKIRLSNGMEVTVSKNRDLDCGIQLTYTADQM